jgi:hypothetical protein
MDQSSSSGKFTREDLSTEVKDYFARNPEMYQRLLSMDNRELDTNNPLGKVLTEIRDGGGRSVSALDGPADKEQETIIRSKTASTPKILGAKSRMIDRVQGEVPINGQFEITYRYAINDPANVPDGKRPEDYGKIEPITPGSSFTKTNKLGLVGEPKVTVNAKRETIEVEKTERYEVQGLACGATTCAINFKIVVTDPVNTDKKAEVRSTTAPGIGDNRPQYIPVRNVPKPERGR